MFGREAPKFFAYSIVIYHGFNVCFGHEAPKNRQKSAKIQDSGHRLQQISHILTAGVLRLSDTRKT